MTKELKTLTVDGKDYNYIVTKNDGVLIRSDYSIRFKVTDKLKKQIANDVIGGLTGVLFASPLQENDVDEMAVYTFTGPSLEAYTNVSFLHKREVILTNRTEEKSYPEYFYKLIMKHLEQAGIQADEMSVLEDKMIPEYDELISFYKSPSSVDDTGIYAHFADGEEKMVNYNETVVLDNEELSKIEIAFWTKNEMNYIEQFGTPKIELTMGSGVEGFGGAATLSVLMGNGEYYSAHEEYLIENELEVPDRASQLENEKMGATIDFAESVNTVINRVIARRETQEEISEFIKHKLDRSNSEFDSRMEAVEREFGEKSIKILTRRVVNYVLENASIIK